jgi:hypothetical protein
MRVLYLPHNARGVYFGALLRTGAAEKGWHIDVACGPSSLGFARALNQDVGANIHTTPDHLVAATKRAGPDIEKVISESERCAGVPVSRIALAGARDLGRAFGRNNYHWAESALARAVRRDPTLTERVIAAIFDFGHHLLEEVKPNLVITSMPAEPLHFALQLLCARSDIPFVLNRPSKILGDRAYWTLDRAGLNGATFVEFAKLRSTGESPRAEAASHAQVFRDKPRPIAFVERNWRQAAGRSWIDSHVQFAKIARAELSHRIRRRPGAPPKQTIRVMIDYYRSAVLRLRQRHKFLSFDETELKEKRFIYFPLHKEPEFAINYSAPLWHQQIHTAHLIASSLPYGYELLVREHRFNVGRRPMSYYRQLTELPATKLVDAFDDQFKYLKHANLIVTENGSSGWEGVLLKRQVLTLADSFYDAPDLVRRLDSPERLPETLVEMLGGGTRARVSDDDIALFVEAEFRATFGEKDHTAAFDSLDRILSEISAPHHKAAL